MAGACVAASAGQLRRVTGVPVTGQAFTAQVTSFARGIGWVRPAMRNSASIRRPPASKVPFSMGRGSRQVLASAICEEDLRTDVAGLLEGVGEEPTEGSDGFVVQFGMAGCKALLHNVGERYNDIT